MSRKTNKLRNRLRVLQRENERLAKELTKARLSWATAKACEATAQSRLSKAEALSIRLNNVPDYDRDRMALQILFSPSMFRYDFYRGAGENFADVGYYASRIAHEVQDKVAMALVEVLSDKVAR